MASAKTYYVAPTGRDSNAGTITSPWATLDKAFDTAQASDTVFFRGGVYYPTSESQLGQAAHDGTAENPICFFNYPNETPIFDCSNVTADSYTYGIRIYHKDYIEIEGLTIRNLSQSGSSSVVQAMVFELCKNIKVTNCTVYNIEGVGIGLQGCDEGYIKNCDAYNLCDSLQSPYPGQNGVGFGCGTRVSLFGEGMYNVHNYIEGCRTWNFSDNGFASSGVGYLEIKNCWAFNGGMLYGDGIGFKYNISTSGDIVNPLSVYIHNCISADNGMCGFSPNNLNGTVFNGHYYNNFAYHNGYKHELNNYNPTFGTGFFILNYTGSTPAPNEMFSNNISYANEHYSVYAGDAYNHEYNSWDLQGITVTNSDFASLDIAELRWSRKVDGSLPDINFGKLASGSHLIDAGKNVGLTYNGSAPDLGWYETSGTSSPVAPATPVYVSSVVENTTPSRLEMTYNLTLANIVPSASAFAVRVNSVARTVSSVAISGTKVLLTLASPVVYGNVVTVAYTKPSSNPLQTSAGGQAVTISAQNVINNVAAINPLYVSSVVENTTPSRLEMTYNLTLANIVPSASAFAVRVNSVARTVSSVAISGTKVLLTLASPVVYGNVVTVAYTRPSSNPLQTSAGGQAASISDKSVINNCSLAANLPPVINISSPTKSTSFITPATITVDAVATDPDGAISKVEFYNGNTRLGERTATPYSFTWKEVAEGTYSITAVAIDNLNARTVSAAVSVTVEKSATAVNQIPVVSIIATGQNKKPKKHDNIVIVAEASDPDGSISKVELKSGSTTLAELTTVPYTYTLQDVDAGTYLITAMATDNLGAMSFSQVMELTVYDTNSDIINLYPNPNNGHFTIDVFPDLPDENNRISIINLAGKTVYSDLMIGAESSRDFDITFTDPGTYILMVTNGNTVLTTKKFIKN